METFLLFDIFLSLKHNANCIFYQIMTLMMLSDQNILAFIDFFAGAITHECNGFLIHFQSNHNTQPKCPLTHLRHDTNEGWDKLHAETSLMNTAFTTSTRFPIESMWLDRDERKCHQPYACWQSASFVQTPASSCEGVYWWEYVENWHVCKHRVKLNPCILARFHLLLTITSSNPLACW